MHIEEDIQTSRYKGGNKSEGKIIKGTLNDAPIKIKVSSIPAKHENLVYRTNSQPAFGDSKQRFFKPSSATSQYMPGPGLYQPEYNHHKISSKKGTGSFASTSKLQRLEKSKTHIPGPGAYHTSQSFHPKPPNLHANRSTSVSSFSKSRETALLSSKVQTQAHNLFQKQIQESMNTPGPGSYQQTIENENKKRSLSSNFKSNISRFIKKEGPPIGSYNLERVKIEKKTQTLKYQRPQFVLKKQTIENRKEKIQKILKDKQNQSKLKLGPGSYNPQFQKTQKTLKFHSTMYDRFGQLKDLYAIAKSPELPSAVQKVDVEVKRQIGKGLTSVFKSKTKRPDLHSKQKVDPASYKNTSPLGKKSHLINFSRKWV